VARLEKHPKEKIYLAWDNANTHQDDEVEAGVRGAAGRLVLLTDLQPVAKPNRNALVSLPSSGHPLRAVWGIQNLVEASLEFVRRFNDRPEQLLSIIGAKLQLHT
jgi:hypothetical protein